MSAMLRSLGPDSSALPLAEHPVAGLYEVLECAAVDLSGFVFCDFSPTHSPNPSLAPPGERGGLHLAASVKVGNLVIESVLASKWVQRSHEALKSISAQRQLATQWPQRRSGLLRSIFAQRQLASTCLQQIEKQLNSFDGNVPMRTFFPPSKTRPNVAVSSLSAPAGVERVGVRGGIQRLKNKNAPDNRFRSSTGEPMCGRKVLQKQERTRHVARGLEARKPKNMMATTQRVAANRELT